MKMKFMALMLGAFALPTLALAGAGNYNTSLYNAVNNAPTCNGVFDIASLTSKPAGVTTVAMRHISDLSRSEQQDLARLQGSASLEAEFHLGSDDCWYMLLKTRSSGRTRTAVAPSTSSNTQFNFIPNTTVSTTSTNNASQTGDVFRVNDINFSLASVNVLTVEPTVSEVELAYADMTEDQQESLVAFFGSQADGATIYRTIDGMWNIMF